MLELDVTTADKSSRATLEKISLTVAKSKRIVVVTGAGISCSSGIPDFRSSDGLYNLVKQRYPNAVLKGRDLFCSSLFQDPTSTSVFYTFISQLKQSIDRAKPSTTHHFIKMLDSKKRLLRSYTQNIDGFEERLGMVGGCSGEARPSQPIGKGKRKVVDVRNVQLHGDIHRVRCTFCSAGFPCTAEHMEVFDEGSSPDCPECVSRSAARQARSARALKIGNLRPAIVLYDEPHPHGDEIGRIQTADLAKKPDMLIVMGTSLKVHGLKALVKDFARVVHGSSTGASQTANDLSGKVIFINRTPPPPEWSSVFDYWVNGETDAWAKLVEDDWRARRPSDWQTQTTLDGTVKTMKATSVGKKPKADAFRAPAKKSVKAPSVTQDVDENCPFLSSQATQSSDSGPPPSSPSPSCTSDSPPSSQLSSPSSPSKRRRRGPNSSPDSLSEAESDLEDSPSKKRTLAATTLPGPEVKRLFHDTTNRSIDERVPLPLKPVKKSTGRPTAAPRAPPASRPPRLVMQARPAAALGKRKAAVGKEDTSMDTLAIAVALRKTRRNDVKQNRATIARYVDLI